MRRRRLRLWGMQPLKQGKAEAETLLQEYEQQGQRSPETQVEELQIQQTAKGSSEGSATAEGRQSGS